MTEELIYSASEVYKRLHISDSTLRKYMDVLHREGFRVKKDTRGRREYTEKDVMVIEKLIELSKHDGMTLEKAAKIIAQKLGILHTDGTPHEQPQGNDVISHAMQQQFHQHYSVITKKLDQSMVEMEKRLREQEEVRSRRIEEQIQQHHERVEKKLEVRDKNLLQMLRDMQETKKLMQHFHAEFAVTKEGKRPWWKFW
ncbi:DUF3967 domain-containing protein [Bacillus thuringiensis]|uniref:DUF3967 domain-containing protein n=1 Tax=Bacillus thuringiensis TaxID=1428 RepID=UPI0010AC6415|nr:DUF3967 domain-containing protein [Bacillus thuringiensis]TKA00364.1 DUF3967 domain-containing protein [Bacillus thuringiensis]